MIKFTVRDFSQMERDLTRLRMFHKRARAVCFRHVLADDTFVLYNSKLRATATLSRMSSYFRGETTECNCLNLRKEATEKRTGKFGE